MHRAARCDLVVSATRVQGPGIGRGVGEFLQPALRDGEELPDHGLTIRLYGRRLQGFRDAMVKTDAYYLEQRAVLSDLFRESETSTGKLKASIKSLRSTCEGLLGADRLRSLGLDFKLAQDLQGAVRQGEIIRDRLRGSDGELVPERWVKAPLTREGVAEELDDEIEEARRVSRRLVKQRKVVDTAKVRKDQALEEFDQHFIPIARVIEATFRVVGETELADRIRPTVRGLDRAGGEEDSAEPEASEPGAAESGVASESGAASESEAPAAGPG